MAVPPRTFRIVVAPDSFKGSMSAVVAARAIARGLRRSLPRALIDLVPMADGGEGTAETIVRATGGRLLHGTVSDPLGRPVRAAWGLSGNGRAAIVEMAAASGLLLLRPAERNPMRTTTKGTGELVRVALDRGVERILMGIGGSATVDGGTGMARALGYRFLDASGREIPEGGGALARLARIDPSRADARLKRVRVDVACDVVNPLAGPRGAACVYGPQKGATSEMVRELDRGLRCLAERVRLDLGLRVAHVPGAGAAGGLGAGLLAFTGARLQCGVDLVMDAVGLRERMRACDLVITGEGRMDRQTAFGKTPAGVARIARECRVPVLAICGSLGRGVRRVLAAGIDAYFTALQESVAEVDLPARAPGMLADCAEQVGRLLALSASMKRGWRGGT